MASKLLTAGKLTASQIATRNAGKTIVAMAKRAADVADFNREKEAADKLHNVLTQQGNGVGLRISGAASHAFADQLEALARIVLAGNVPSFTGGNVPAPAAE